MAQSLQRISSAFLVRCPRACLGLLSSSCVFSAVASGQLNSAVAKVDGKNVEYTFKVSRYLKAPKVAGETLSLTMMKVRIQSPCTCSSPPKTVILAGNWIGDANSRDGHILVDYSASGVLEPYQREPWKLWHRMYNYGGELKKITCREQSWCRIYANIEREWLVKTMIWCLCVCTELLIYLCSPFSLEFIYFCIHVHFMYVHSTRIQRVHAGVQCTISSYSI